MQADGWWSGPGQSNKDIRRGILRELLGQRLRGG
jgi:hypothetical protein